MNYSHVELVCCRGSRAQWRIWRQSWLLSWTPSKTHSGAPCWTKQDRQWWTSCRIQSRGADPERRRLNLSIYFYRKFVNKMSLFEQTESFLHFLLLLPRLTWSERKLKKMTRRQDRYWKEIYFFIKAIQAAC